jgi:hypothetical protein
MGRRTSTLGR